MKTVAVIAATGAAWLLALAPARTLAQDGRDRAGTLRAADLAGSASRAIVRTVLIDTRLRANAASADFRLASIVMGLAQELAPNDEELVRWQISLADAGEDTAALDRHLTRLLELSPRDTVAQYRLISSRIRAVQKIQERLEKYERVLGPGGAALDPSIRSRLALEAAALCRERGDDAGFVAKLKLATGLDATNKEAALAALTYFAEKTKDQMGRLELLANVLYADPADPNVHLEMAREFYAGGDFESAQRFQDNALSVYTRAGVDRATPGLLEELTIDWPVDGAAQVVTRLNKALDIRRSEARRIIAQLKAEGQSTAAVPAPEDIRLDPSLDRIRILAARTAGDKETADNAFADLRKRYDEAFVQLKSNAGAEGLDFDPVSASRSLHLELGLLLFWANQATDMAAQELEAALAEPGTDPSDPDVLEVKGWSLARTDRAAEAISILTPLADERPVACLGLGAAYEQLGQKDEAVAEYARVLRQYPMTIEACWALGRVRELTGAPTPDPAQTKKLRAFAAGVPSLVDDMSREPRKAMSLDAELEAASALPTEPALLRVTLTNTTTVPLGVGPGRTIDSRVLVNPALEVRIETLRAGVLPEVLDLERRIRLMPRESLQVTFWPDPGLTGWIVENHCDQTVRVLWRLLQGFVRGPEGGIDAGPTSLSVSTRSQVRSPLPEAFLSPAELGARLGGASDAELAALVLAARSRLLAIAPAENLNEKKAEPVSDLSAPPPLSQDRPALKDEDQALIAQGAAQRYRNSGPTARMLLLAALPHAGQVPAMKALDDVARAETDPAVACLVLMTRVSDPKDEMLERGAGSGDPRLIAAATLMRERLEAGNPCYAKLGPGLQGLIGRARENGR